MFIWILVLLVKRRHSAICLLALKKKWIIHPRDSPFHSIEVKYINADDAIAGCRYLIIKIHFAPPFSYFALPHTFLSFLHHYQHPHHLHHQHHHHTFSFFSLHNYHVSASTATTTPTTTTTFLLFFRPPPIPLSTVFLPLHLYFRIDLGSMWVQWIVL